jgi:hypothetical protein
MRPPLSSLCVTISLVGIMKHRLSAVITMPLQLDPKVMGVDAALASTVFGG